MLRDAHQKNPMLITNFQWPHNNLLSNSLETCKKAWLILQDLQDLVGIVYLI